MSVILDALKKLEQEKQTRSTGPVTVRTETLLRDYRRPGGSRRMVAIMAAVVVLAAGAVLFFVMNMAPKGGTAVTGAADEHRVVDAPPVPAASPVSSAPAPPGTSSAVPPAAPAATPPAAEVLRDAPPVDDEPPIARARQAKRARTAVPPVAPSTERPHRSKGGVTQETPSDLAVSGIAWSEGRAERRAVINGGLYPEGATVGAASIVLILQDRVRFNRDGRTFDVPLSTPFPAR